MPEKREPETTLLLQSDPEALNLEVTCRGRGTFWRFQVPGRKFRVAAGTLLTAGLLALGIHEAAKWPYSESTASTAQDAMVNLALDKDATPSLFCFSIMQPTGYEPALVKAQLDKRASIFACNEYAVISPEKQPIGNVSWGQVWTWKNTAPPVRMGKYGQNGQKTDSFLNTATFLQAWDTLIKSGRMWKHDFIVKVDPDAVFFPDRLRAHVKAENGTSVFYTNCGKWGPKALLYGSVEVFSKQALQAYAHNVDRCKQLPWHGWGEDYYMQHCMQMIGVREVVDVNQVGDHRCIAATCDDYTKVAFHDFKNSVDWFKCYNMAIGKKDEPATTAEPATTGAPATTMAEATEATSSAPGPSASTTPQATAQLPALAASGAKTQPMAAAPLG